MYEFSVPELLSPVVLVTAAFKLIVLFVELMEDHCALPALFINCNIPAVPDAGAKIPTPRPAPVSVKATTIPPPIVPVKVGLAVLSNPGAAVVPMTVCTASIASLALACWSAWEGLFNAFVLIGLVSASREVGKLVATLGYFLSPAIT